MALSIDTTYMRLETCMALFQRWRGLNVSPRDPEPDPYADMQLDAIRRSVVRGRIQAMRPGATYEEIAQTLGVTKKTLWEYRKDMGIEHW